jgi:protein gp37
MDPSWVIDVRNQCQRAAVPFFFKQWGGVFKKRAGRALEGRTWDAMPDLDFRKSRAGRFRAPASACSS